MSYRTVEFKRLNDEFAHAAINLLNDSRPSIRQLEYALDTYNTIITYSEIDFEKKKKSTKEHIISTVEANRITIQRCYEKLGIPVTLPGKLLSTIHYIPDSNPNYQHGNSNSDSKNNSSDDSKTNSTNDSNTKNNSSDNSIPNSTGNSNHNQNPVNNSTMEPAQYLKLCGSQINRDFSGDPLTLKSFISSIKLLKSIAPNNANTLKLFVISKLTGKALECIRAEPETVEEIIEDLNKFIKPDNSKIIEGRLQALRFNNNKAQEFSQQAEELAEALQRTLIIEGISQEKAREMTVERTVDMCRQSARTDFVRSVMASTSFQTPKDALAKFIIENSKEKAEKQILAIRQQNSRANSQNNYQNRNTNGRGRGNFNGQRQRNYNNNDQNGSNGNNFRNNRGNGRNYRSNQRGRGGYRNNYNNYNNNNNNNDRYVRVVAENYHSPSIGRAEPEGAPANQSTILRLAHNNQ